MASIKINSEDFDLKKVLAGISELDLEELKQVMSQVSTFIAQKKAPNFSKEETKLIKKIHKGLPIKTQKRYNELRVKILNETITSKEHKELIQLVEVFETKSNERLKYIVELALLWNTTTDVVMEKLDLKSPPPIHA